MLRRQLDRYGQLFHRDQVCPMRKSPNDGVQAFARIEPVQSETKLLARFHDSPTQLRRANYKWPWRICQTAGAVWARHRPEYSRLIFLAQKVSQSAPQDVAGQTRRQTNLLTRA